MASTVGFAAEAHDEGLPLLSVEADAAIFGGTWTMVALFRIPFDDDLFLISFPCDGCDDFVFPVLEESFDSFLVGLRLGA